MFCGLQFISYIRWWCCALFLACDSCVIVLLEDLDKVNERYQSIAHQLSSLNASSTAWAQLNRLNAAIQDIAVSPLSLSLSPLFSLSPLTLSHTHTPHSPLSLSLSLSSHTHSLTHHSLHSTHSLTHHSLTHSLTHSLITHSLTHSHTHTHTHPNTLWLSIRTFRFYYLPHCSYVVTSTFFKYNSLYAPECHK